MPLCVHFSGFWNEGGAELEIEDAPEAVDAFERPRLREAVELFERLRLERPSVGESSSFFFRRLYSSHQSFKFRSVMFTSLCR